MSPTEQENDIQELIRSIAEERRSAKEKERRESWTRYVSLMVVVLAVATGISSLKAGGFSTKVVLNQGLASDQWAYYQAKSIKQRIAEMEARSATGAVAAAAAEDVARYKNDQKASQAKARHWGSGSRSCRSPSRWRRFACSPSARGCGRRRACWAPSGSAT